MTKAPQIDPIRFGRLATGDVDDLTKNADLEDLVFTDLSLPELTLPGAVLSAVRFAGVNAQDADLKGARFSEVELDRVHLPVARASRSRWRDVRISGRIGGLECYDAEWRSVHLDGCKLDYLNLRGAELLDVQFTDCVIGELDLLDAVVRRLRFTGCRIGHLNVQRSDLHDVDLRGAELEVVDGLLDLGGATVTPDQLTLLAPLLAEQIGIKVE